MTRNPAPVIAAQALLAYGLNDASVVTYVGQTWQLDRVDARAAVDAAHTLSGRQGGIRVAEPCRH